MKNFHSLYMIHGKEKRKILKLFFILFIIVGMALLINKQMFQPHGDSWASADAWVDNNRNGEKDLGEPPLAGVCIESFDYKAIYNVPSTCEQNLITDALGIWHGSEFFAGASCNDVFIYAFPLDGYTATTRLKVNGCVASFGFAPISSPSVP